MTGTGVHSTGEIPERIGPFRVLDILGEGGMSIVYRAEQEEPVSRQVALKVLKPGMETRQIIARFESERQALAVLDHPGIAKIYEGGVTEQGLPYFAMERVHGVPINEYCDDNRLTMRERVAVFVEVCSAVQHAHHKGLIHRDLKPSNILVGVADRKPRVKVIDFGIAKATGASLTDKTLFTKVGQLIGTPQYMSPEQADSSGLDVDTRADIYSLGVILYELLVGTVPLELAQVADHAVSHVIREKDPPKPSTKITQLGETGREIARVRRSRPGELRKNLSGDLDWIVMKAIEKDRTRRYETANALAMECRRYLNHEPVLARSPSSTYLLKRFVRRNRVVVGWATVAILAIIAGGVSTTIGMLRAQRAERVAITEAETTESVYRFLVNLFGVSNPYASDRLSSNVSARDMVQRGAEKLDSELRDTPLVRARLMNTLGIILVNLGEHEQASDLIAEAFRIRQSNPDTPADDLADSYYANGQLAYETGRYPDSVSYFRRAVAAYENALGAGSVPVADTLEFMAAGLAQQSRVSDAIEALERARRILESDPATPDVRIAENLNAIAFTLFLSGDYVAAGEVFEDAMPYFEKGARNGLYARAAGNLATSLQQTGRTLEAIDAHQKALTLRREVFGPDHVEVGISQNNLGNLLRDISRFDEAQSKLEEALRIFESVLGPDHGNVAIVYIGLGHVMRESGRLDEARRYLDLAQPIVANAFGSGSMRDVQLRLAYGYTALMDGDLAESETAFRQAVRVGRELGPAHVDLGAALVGLAASQATAEFGERDRLFSEGISMMNETAGPTSIRTLDGRLWFARFLASSGRAEQAKKEFQEVLVALRSSMGDGNGTYARYRAEYERTFDP